MGTIRALAAGDLPALARLRRLSFRHSHQPTEDALARYLGEVFLEHPWRRLGLESLVYEGDAGEPVGFLGIIPRAYVLDGERLTAAVLSHFMVHPDARGGGIGRRLMAQYLDGPQDLAWSDVANEATRAVWLANGGVVATLHSLHWRLALRPMREATFALARHPAGRAAYLALRPLAALADGALARGSSGALGTPVVGRALPVALAEVPALLDSLTAGRALRASYGASDIAWLAGHLARNRDLGAFASMAVRDDAGAPLGWYAWGRRGGTASVVQLIAREGRLGDVMGHLVRDAWAAGAVALEGRLDPPSLAELTARGAVLGRDGPWVLLHTRRADVRDAVLRGDTALGRLDGEWWMVA